MTLHQTLLDRLTAQTLPVFGFDGAFVQQGTPEWHRMRTGVITASRAKDLVATGGLAPFPDDVEIIKDGRQNTVTFGGKTFTGTKAECVSFVRHALPPLPSDARNTYMLELIAEIATGQPKEVGRFKTTEWGINFEDIARQMVAFHLGQDIHQVPFVYGDESMRYGCSPDGIADDSGVEIKVPWCSDIYLDFVLNGKIKPEYVEQVQFCMYVTNCDHWTFANYDPRMRTKSIHAVSIERSDIHAARFTDAIGQMSYDIDKYLSILGIEFGEQWK